MKAFIKSQIAIASAILLILAGCSENLITQNGNESLSNTVSETTELKSINQFKGRIKIDANESYTFDYSNTGLRTFYSIKVSDCGKLSSNYDIIGYGDDFITFLECDSQNFSVWSIEIRNNSLVPLELEVSLTGSKARLIQPGTIKTKTE
ncbi:MAG TPA: hypothetical protein PKD83_05460 [Ignavibacteria bacterium]|mgnify:CR=1 FL=1|nr:hypothetical protein [Ignavibacteria bacterium]